LRAGFPHSEIFGSKLACQLPEAYRRLQRPSSPVVAKASTTCTCSLDPITVRTISENGASSQVSLCAWWDHGRLSRNPNTSNAISYPDEPDRLRQSGSPCFFRIFKEQPNKTKCTEKGSPFSLHSADDVVSPDPGGANRDRTGDLLLAKQALSQLSYGPNSFPVAGVGWWVWMDSNHRPPPYQDDALTN
jgi:hypothetical protein